MNRLISILITLFVIFLIYIWINSVMSNKSTADIQPNQRETSTPNNESLEKSDDKTLKLSNYDEQNQEDKTIESSQESSSSDMSDNKLLEKEELNEDKNPAPIAIPVNQKPIKEKPVPLKKVANAANMHLVIAGNFLQRVNAESRQKELQQNGYKSAEIVNFDLSEYYTVIAGRFDDVTEARRIAKKVNDYLNIEAYVRIGKN